MSRLCASDRIRHPHLPRLHSMKWKGYNSKAINSSSRPLQKDSPAMKRKYYDFTDRDLWDSRDPFQFQNQAFFGAIISTIHQINPQDIKNHALLSLGNVSNCNKETGGLRAALDENDQEQHIRDILRILTKRLTRISSIEQLEATLSLCSYLVRSCKAARYIVNEEIEIRGWMNRWWQLAASQLQYADMEILQRILNSSIFLRSRPEPKYAQLWHNRFLLVAESGDPHIVIRSLLLMIEMKVPIPSPVRDLWLRLWKEWLLEDTLSGDSIALAMAAEIDMNREFSTDSDEYKLWTRNLFSDEKSRFREIQKESIIYLLKRSALNQKALFHDEQFTRIECVLASQVSQGTKADQALKVMIDISRLRYKISKSTLWPNLRTILVRDMPRMSNFQLALLVSSMAKLELQADDELFNLWESQIDIRVDSLSAETLSRIIWALSQQKIAWSGPAFDKWRQAYIRHIAHLSNGLGDGTTRGRGGVEFLVRGRLALHNMAALTLSPLAVSDRPETNIHPDSGERESGTAISERNTETDMNLDNSDLQAIMSTPSESKLRMRARTPVDANPPVGCKADEVQLKDSEAVDVSYGSNEDTSPYRFTAEESQHWIDALDRYVSILKPSDVQHIVWFLGRESPQHMTRERYLVWEPALVRSVAEFDAYSLAHTLRLIYMNRILPSSELLSKWGRRVAEKYEDFHLRSRLDMVRSLRRLETECQVDLTPVDHLLDWFSDVKGKDS